MRKFSHAPFRVSTGLTLTALLTAGFAAPAGSGAEVQPPAGAKTLLLGVAASGVVQKIMAEDGAHVDAGQILLQLDCRPLEAKVKLRAAARDAVEAAYERTRNGSRL